jgi:hypothetical protein
MIKYNGCRVHVRASCQLEVTHTVASAQHMWCRDNVFLKLLFGFAPLTPACTAMNAVTCMDQPDGCDSLCLPPPATVHCARPSLLVVSRLDSAQPKNHH